MGRDQIVYVCTHCAPSPAVDEGWEWAAYAEVQGSCIKISN